jgi:membrane-associated phospholipid phosphatase
MTFLALIGLAMGAEWDDDWPRFSDEELVITGVATAGLAVFSVINPPAVERWDSRLPLDTPFYNLLAAPQRRGAMRAARASDVLVWSLAAWPWIDTIAAGNSEGNGLAREWALMNTQSMVISTLANRVVSTAAGRARPYSARCESEPDFNRQCGKPDQYRSFFSGHTALAFSSAGLVCAHHANVPLYGGKGADAVACGVSMATATTVGTLRMVAHRHYFSDVLVGAAVGGALGAGLPLLHYRRSDADPAERSGQRMTATISGRF